MTIATDTAAVRSRPVQMWLAIWAAALAAVLILFLARGALPWAVNYPANAVVPVADWVSAIMNWLKINMSWLTRSITAILGVPLDFALDLLAKNFKIGAGPEATVLPRLSWVGVCAAAYLAGRAFGGWRLGALVGGLFLYVALFGKWTSAMLTLGLISIAVPFCIVTGLFLGIWAWRRPWAEKLIVSPALDLMQTIPTFAYLIPMLLFVRQQPGLGDDRHRDLRHAADGARHHARAVARAGRDQRVQRNGRLHGAPETVASASAVGAADADGRR